jgi:hypothetical protein
MFNLKKKSESDKPSDAKLDQFFGKSDVGSEEAASKITSAVVDSITETE